MSIHDEAYWARKQQELENAERAAARKEAERQEREDRRRMTHGKASDTEKKAARKLLNSEGLNRRQASVLEVLRAAGRDGLTGTEVHNLMEVKEGRTDVSWSVYRSRLTELERHGLATKTNVRRANHRDNEEVVWRALEDWERTSAATHAKTAIGSK